ncbi:MAG: hypothetical protein ACPL5F_09520 [Moorellaceae bacterium]
MARRGAETNGYGGYGDQIRAEKPGGYWRRGNDAMLMEIDEAWATGHR